MTDPRRGEPGRYERGVHVALVALAVGAALIGFVLGARPDRIVRPGDTVGSERASTTSAAPRYGEIRRSEDDITGRELDELRASAARGRVWPTSSALDATLDPRLDRRQHAIDQRAGRRAYAGAPPTVPHPIEQRTDGACLDCHEHGIELGDVSVPAMSHEPLTQCVQCHAGSVSPFGTAIEFWQPADTMPPNTFQGLTSPQRGERAWIGAPPTIPHATTMRSECTSCHGTTGPEGLGTSHPWRTSCTQCHAPSAALDQVPRTPGLAPGPPLATVPEVTSP